MSADLLLLLASCLQKILYYSSDDLLIKSNDNETYLNAPVTGKYVILTNSIFGKVTEAIAGRSKSHDGPVTDKNKYVCACRRPFQAVYI